MALALLEVRRLECGEGKSPVPGLGLLSGGLSFRKGTGVSACLLRALSRMALLLFVMHVSWPLPGGAAVPQEPGGRAEGWSAPPWGRRLLKSDPPGADGLW